MSVKVRLSPGQQVCGSLRSPKWPRHFANTQNVKPKDLPANIKLGWVEISTRVFQTLLSHDRLTTTKLLS